MAIQRGDGGEANLQSVSGDGRWANFMFYRSGGGANFWGVRISAHPYEEAVD